MTNRIYNFCAGPCTLPLPVLKEAQAELLDFQGSGMSVMEISHRSKRFEPLHEETIALAQEISGAPAAFIPLLLPGGAHQQFTMTAMNLLPDAGDVAVIINSGIWATKAYEEANRIGKMNEIWSGKSSGFTSLPNREEMAALRYPAAAKYLHLTSNETIGGIQFREFPALDLPLVIDASSDYFTRDLPWERCAVVYGGVQKNLAPAGLSLTFVHRDVLRDLPHVPKFLTYQAHAAANSLYNTPPTWQIYLLNKVFKWMKAKGGIAHFAEDSIAKSSLLYEYLDSSTFYHNDLAREYRSHTNVIFRTPTPELDTLFWQTADRVGLNGLKGHRIVGGLRASLYNALEKEAVVALIEFMKEFAEQHQ